MDERERLQRIEAAARSLVYRKETSPSEDAHIFAEWDDLLDALDAVSWWPDVMRLQPDLVRLQNDEISTGKMRDVIRDWLDGE